jgi:hypothetical protein
VPTRTAAGSRWLPAPLRLVSGPQQPAIHQVCRAGSSASTAGCPRRAIVKHPGQELGPFPRRAPSSFGEQEPSPFAPGQVPFEQGGRPAAPHDQDGHRPGRAVRHPVVLIPLAQAVVFAYADLCSRPAVRCATSDGSLHPAGLLHRRRDQRGGALRHPGLLRGRRRTTSCSGCGDGRQELQECREQPDARQPPCSRFVRAARITLSRAPGRSDRRAAVRRMAFWSAAGRG